MTGNRMELINGSILELNRGYKMDCLEMMKSLPDKSVGLIMADPPYFEVKGDFDFVWNSFDDYLKDVEKWAIECKRILQDNGSLFWWGDARKIAYSQIILDKYFKLENSLVWENTNQHKQQLRFSGGLRKFAPISERLLFYSKEDSINLTKCIFFIRDYIREEIIKSKGCIVFGNINKAIGTATNGGGVASACLSLKKTDPAMITKDIYIKLQKYCYPFLRKEYEELRKEYEELRRPFSNIFNLGDVIHFANRDMGEAEHDTIKPCKLIKELLQITTKKDTLVFIPFWGSGTESVGCYELGLNWFATEISDKHFLTASNRQKESEKQERLQF